LKRSRVHSRTLQAPDIGRPLASSARCSALRVAPIRTSSACAVLTIPARDPR
jgi:hypothetical protein